MNHYWSAAFVLVLGLSVGCDRERTDVVKHQETTSAAPTPQPSIETTGEDDELTRLSQALKAQGAQLKADLKKRADATPPSSTAIASYANIMADEGEAEEAREYVSRLKQINPRSEVAAVLTQYLSERGSATDEKALRELRMAHTKRFFAAVQADADSAMTVDQRLALAAFGEASKRGDNAIMEAAQKINDEQVAELKKRYDVCAGVALSPSSKSFDQEMELQSTLFDLERKKGQDGVMAALPALLEQHPHAAIVYSTFLRHRIDRDEFAEARALVKRARAALPDAAEFRIIEDSLNELMKAPSAEEIGAKKLKLTVTLATLAGAQIDCMDTTK